MAKDFPLRGFKPATYFVARLSDSRSDLLVQNADTLRWAAGRTFGAHPTNVLAWVTLPSSIHTIWRGPFDLDSDRCWGEIKARFALATCGTEAPVWDAHVEERPICTPVTLADAMERCRQAPVHAGLVTRAEAWPLARVTSLPKAASAA